jgi:hypothetical protein
MTFTVSSMNGISEQRVEDIIASLGDMTRRSFISADLGIETISRWDKVVDHLITESRVTHDVRRAKCRLDICRGEDTVNLPASDITLDILKCKTVVIRTNFAGLSRTVLSNPNVIGDVRTNGIPTVDDDNFTPARGIILRRGHVRLREYTTVVARSMRGYTGRDRIAISISARAEGSDGALDEVGKKFRHIASIQLHGGRLFALN